MRAYYNQRVGGGAQVPRLTLAETSTQLVACYDDLA